MNPYKSIKGAFALIALLCLALTSAQAQLSTNTFFGSFESYISQQNTNFTFTGTRAEVSVGADYTSGAVWAQYASLQYNIGTGSWAVSGKIRNDSIAGVVKSFELGPTYELYQQYDTQLSATLYGGYDREAKNGEIEPTLTLRKKATTNTYFEIGTSFPITFAGNQSWIPNVFIGTGFTF